MTGRRGQPPRTGGEGGVDQESVRSLERVINETRTLFHHMKRAAEQIHEVDEVSAGGRAMLLDLKRDGSRTVPALARARPVSRQHVQMIVNPLVVRGLVTRADNPRHQRSRLVELTEKGHRLATRLERREATVLKLLAAELRGVDLAGAADVLLRVRRVFDDAYQHQEGVHHET